jgi:hypothetical protein
MPPEYINNVHLNLAMHGSSGQSGFGWALGRPKLSTAASEKDPPQAQILVSQQHPPCLPAHHPLPFTRLSSSTLTNLSAVTWISHIPHISHNDRRPPLPRPARNPDRRIPEIDHSFPESSRPEGSERLCFRQRCQGDGRS